MRQLPFHTMPNAHLMKYEQQSATRVSELGSCSLSSLLFILSISHFGSAFVLFEALLSLRLQSLFLSFAFGHFSLCFSFTHNTHTHHCVSRCFHSNSLCALCNTEVRVTRTNYCSCSSGLQTNLQSYFF